MITNTPYHKTKETIVTYRCDKPATVFPSIFKGYKYFKGEKATNTDTILKKIITILKTSTPYKISTFDCMNYILGNKLEEADLRDDHSDLIPGYVAKTYSQDSLSPTTLQAVAVGKRTPSNDILTYLVSSDDWSISRLKTFYNNGLKASDSDFKELIAQISALYNDLIPNFPSDTFSKKVEMLLRLHFFGTTDTTLFPKIPKKVTPYYIPWDQKNTELHVKIKKSNIVFVTGFPGSGKKQLVYYYLNTYAIPKNHYLFHNIGWLDVTLADSSLESAFAKSLYFLGKDISNSNDKLQLLSEKKSPALIIITCPYLKKEDFEFIKKNLLSTRTKYIIITRTRIPDAKISVSLDKCPTHILKKIFKRQFHSRFFSKEEFNTLCSRASYNPLTISLIAKMLCHVEKKEDYPQNHLLHLKKSLLDSKTWIWKERSRTKITSLYRSSTKTGVSIAVILQRMLSDLPEQSMTPALSELALWSRYPIPFDFLKSIVDPQTISFATEHDFFESNDSETSIISMPCLLAETILSKCPLSFSDYELTFRKIIYLSTAIKTATQNFALVYTSIYNALFYFQYDAIKLKTRIKNSEDFHVFYSWNNFLSDAITYYSALGNRKFSSALSDELYVQLNYNDPMKKKNPTPLQNIANDSVQLAMHCTFGGDNHSICKHIDSLSSEIEKLPSVYESKESLTLYNIIRQVSETYIVSFDRIVAKIYSSIGSCDPWEHNFWKLINQLTQMVNSASPAFLSNATIMYVKMIQNYILGILQPENAPFYIDEGDNYYKIIKECSYASCSLKLKTSLYGFLNILIYSYRECIYHHQLPSPDKYEYFSFKYDELYQEWKDRLCSSQNIQLLFSATCFYLKMLKKIPRKYKPYTSKTLFQIQDALSRLESLLTTQTTPHKNEYQEVSSLLEKAYSTLTLLKSANENTSPER